MPIRKSVQVDGSGINVRFVPARVSPARVPNEKVALVTVVAAVTPGTARLNVTPLSRKGL
jgi:hypothetical protein